MSPDYERMLERFYCQVLQNGDIAVDVGAHIGRHTFPMASSIGTRGLVYAFEPLPVQFKKLSDGIQGNIDGNIKLFNHALADITGELTFVEVPDFPEYSGFKERIYHDQSIRRMHVNVEVKRLDDVLYDLTSLKFMKLDAEGAELMILRGAENLIRRLRPYVSFELGDAALVNYDYSSADVFEYFSGMGYSIYSIFGVLLSKDDFVTSSRLQNFWDYVAIPAELTWPAAHEPVKVLLQQLSGASENNTGLQSSSEGMNEVDFFKSQDCRTRKEFG